MKRIVVIAGTRPEIIKIAPIIRKLEEEKRKYIFVYTGQHYDYQLSNQIIDDLELPPPDYNFQLKSSISSIQIAEIMTKLEKIVKMKNDIILVQGDTNSVLAASLFAIKQNKKLVHVEAGLRSFDWKMPEEHNRRMVDHISDYLLAPTKESKQNLINEKVNGKIFVTGNTVMDAVKDHIKLSNKKSKIQNNIKFNNYILATFHRAENVDDKKNLQNIIQGIVKSNLPIVIPLHPRTKKMMKKFSLFKKIKTKNIQIIPPQGYLDFLSLMKNCKFIVTDSGGIQEEATSKFLAKKVIVLRDSTERPEALENGNSILLQLNQHKISKQLKFEWNQKFKISKQSPYGNGNSSKKIINILKKI
jgi:UDP-N-acetylglucosamine 2-epimerase (non-hydrolysing)